jgi:hypothetical protein
MKKPPRYSHLTMEPFNKQIEVPPDLNRAAIPAVNPPPAAPATESGAHPATSPATPPAPPATQPSEAVAPPADQPTASPETTARTYEIVIPVVAPPMRGDLARKLAARQANAPEAPALDEPTSPEDSDVPPPLPDYEPIFRAADIVTKYLSKIANVKPGVDRPLPAEDIESSPQRHYVRPGFSATRPPAARHSRKCSICNHPDREAIEFAFIHWDSVDWIARRHRIDRQILYRHAHALNLFERRGRNVAAVLEKLMEDASVVRANPASIIQAVRAYSRITDYVTWSEPPQTHIRAESPKSARRLARSPRGAKKKRRTIRKARKFSPRRPISNRYKTRLENRASRYRSMR